MNKSKQLNFRLIIAYASILFFGILVQIVIGIAYPDISDDRSFLLTFSSVFNLVSYFLFFSVFVYLSRNYLKAKIKQIVKDPHGFAKGLVFGGVLIFAASIIASVILNFLTNGEQAQNQEMLEEMFKDNFFNKISLVIYSVLFAPLVEELLFRKSINGLFKNPVIGLIISSLAFGLIHVISGGDYIQIIYYAALGFALGASYMISKKNIFVPIILHMGFNALVTFSLFLIY
ncbi:hypothetical protein CI105_08810 [Candidatus Izimaplasma bacterium ZiA1]|uniref:CPBP family intramembrane glutamic endopeptidase n=1 Tax=Candidatus Izimoplasma sp. ZiA1 TaxID=2024899 RepID=UPI000BAA38BE|nr:hypothetical protein CI105_08810 [Candidatus Izimaplasma bacterium ZiA1]